ncbi:hypothetical protein P152DRAFT_176968 [Eremomyces bilateralis CBS 781.70]|uniref:Uncharacterized protein n=1 Tax=Eremomyces bilateralis CBS 781.70 TaxID=1392243 RepID=A0A6G1FT50_9PEZI|nr:uncharacterized protein P152DRAFT_176968 [Eremomyces bilateralis CBS 781.70]KAF1808944.1 hypothetical protein P152DRAFT_176968 [Eremomyces bilateralis CBS 781.70]
MHTRRHSRCCMMIGVGSDAVALLGRPWIPWPFRSVGTWTFEGPRPVWMTAYFQPGCHRPPYSPNPFGFPSSSSCSAEHLKQAGIDWPVHPCPPSRLGTTSAHQDLEALNQMSQLHLIPPMRRCRPVVTCITDIGGTIVGNWLDLLERDPTRVCASVRQVFGCSAFKIRSSGLILAILPLDLMLSDIDRLRTTEGRNLYKPLLPGRDGRSPSPTCILNGGMVAYRVRSRYGKPDLPIITVLIPNRQFCWWRKSPSSLVQFKTIEYLYSQRAQLRSRPFFSPPNRCSKHRSFPCLNSYRPLYRYCLAYMMQLVHRIESRSNKTPETWLGNELDISHGSTVPPQRAIRYNMVAQIVKHRQDGCKTYFCV